MAKLGCAFVDGVFTGLDPLGCVMGYVLKKDELFSGHLADKYSYFYMADSEEPIPKQRSLEEQVAKAFGDVVGLGINVFFAGIPQAYYLMGGPGMYYADKLGIKWAQKSFAKELERKRKAGSCL